MENLIEKAKKIFPGDGHRSFSPGRINLIENTSIITAVMSFPAL